MTDTTDKTLDSQALVEQFIKFNKLLGLKLSDTFSADLKIGFSIDEFHGLVQDYQACLESIPQFAFIGQYRYLKRGLLYSIDSRIISMIANRCFGGTGVVDQQPSSAFSLSEDFIGQQFNKIISAYFEGKNCPVEFGRYDTQIKHTHLFFPDEQVFSIEMKCSIQGNQVGSMVFIYPLQFLKQEQEKWSKE